MQHYFKRKNSCEYIFVFHIRCSQLRNFTYDLSWFCLDLQTSRVGRDEKEKLRRLNHHGIFKMEVGVAP